MSEITFRDFAGALMQNDLALAAQHLRTLLGVDATTAEKGVAHFQARMAADQTFMMKAMSMREVVTSKDRARLVPLLDECFGLGAGAEQAADVVLARY